MRYPEPENGTSEPFRPREQGSPLPRANPNYPPSSRVRMQANRPQARVGGPDLLHLSLTRPETWRNLARETLGFRLAADPQDDPRQRQRQAIGFSICFLALVIGFIALRMSPESKVGPYGLIDALSPLYYVALVLLAASFVWNLRPAPYRSLLLGTHLAILVFLVHGAPAVIEPVGRFQTAYIHAGFINYVANTGKLLPYLDARFNWPSFFEGMAMLQKVAGVSNAEIWIRWWPVALNLLYLPLIWAIANELLQSPVKAWVATAIFPLANWEAQDYFSPQSISFLLYLTFIFILIVPLGAHDRPAWERFLPGAERDRRTRQPLVPMTDGTGPPAVGFYLGLLVLLVAAMATGHQLTPLIAMVSTLVLVAAGRTKARGMAVIVPLIAFAWICYGAIIFWQGNINLFLGGLGNLLGNVNSGLSSRTSGNSAHVFAGHVRELISALIWGLALVGAFLWRRHNEDRVISVLLFLAAFSVIAGGNYGGEGILRIYLFSLPFAVCLIAALISMLPQFWSSQVALSAMLLLLIPLFLVARWGNELFEMELPGELAATNALYKMAPTGSDLISLNDFVTLSYEDLISVNERSANLVSIGPQDLSIITALCAKQPNDSFVIITANQIAYGWLDYGMPQNWGATVERMLANSPHYKLRYVNTDAEIFQYIPHPSAQGSLGSKKKK